MFRSPRPCRRRCPRPGSGPARRKRDARVARANTEARKKWAAVAAKEHDILVTDDGNLVRRTAAGGRAKKGMNRSQAEGAAGHLRAELDRQAARRGKVSVRVAPAWTTRQYLTCQGRNTRAGQARVRCGTCGAAHPRDAAGATNLALKHIALIGTHRTTGPSKSGRKALPKPALEAVAGAPPRAHSFDRDQASNACERCTKHSSGGQWNRGGTNAPGKATNRHDHTATGIPIISIIFDAFSPELAHTPAAI